MDKCVADLESITLDYRISESSLISTKQLLANGQIDQFACSYLEVVAGELTIEIQHVNFSLKSTSWPFPVLAHIVDLREICARLASQPGLGPQQFDGLDGDFWYELELLTPVESAERLLRFSDSQDPRRVAVCSFDAFCICLSEISDRLYRELSNLSPDIDSENLKFLHSALKLGNESDIRTNNDS